MTETINDLQSTKTMENVMHVLNNPDDHPDLKRLKVQLDGLPVTLKVNGKWQLEGFVMLFYQLHRLAREIDPTIGSCLPNHCFNPDGITALFRLPADAFDDFEPPLKVGTRRKPGRKNATFHIAQLAENMLRQGKRWPEIYPAVAEAFPNDERAQVPRKVYDAHRRHFRLKDKNRKN